MVVVDKHQRRSSRDEAHNKFFLNHERRQERAVHGLLVPRFLQSGQPGSAGQ